MSIGPEIVVRLSQIVGIDPQNVRSERSERDQTCLRASLRAFDLLQAPILRGEPGAYTVLAGGSRWQALCANALEDGDDFALVPVRACVFEGTDAEALAVSLAENKERAPLHPADEYTAYAGLVSAGSSIERIAKDHGTSRNHVRRRLALAALSPKVLEAFRRGAIGEEAAKAFCASRNHAEQERLLLGEPWALTDPDEIRRRLRGGAVRGSDPKALYVGIDAYVAAGGEAPQNLFEPEIWFSNGELLRRLARDKMQREGQAICAAEGWGWALPEADVNPRARVAVGPDLTAADQARLAEIERIEVGLPSGDPRWAELMLELDQITALGMLRAVPQAERHRYGIVLRLDPDGRLSVDRGMRLGPPTELAPSTVPPAGAPAKGSSMAARAEAGAPQPLVRAFVSEPPPLPATARAACESAANAALAELLATSRHLALIYACAGLGAAAANPTGLRRGTGPRRPMLPVTAELGKADFRTALGLVEGMPNHRLEEVLRDLVRLSLDTRRKDEGDVAALLGVARSLGLRVEEKLVGNFDYAGYFRNAPREANLAAIAEISPEAAVAVRTLRPDVIAGQAALLARSRKWLPPMLRLESPVENVDAAE